MSLEVHKLHTKATQREEIVSTPRKPTKETEAHGSAQVKTTNGTAAHIPQHAVRWQGCISGHPSYQSECLDLALSLSKASTSHWSGWCVQLKANRQVSCGITWCSVSISLLPDSHLKPECGKEVEAKPRSIPVLARTHHTASQLAWDTETFTCTHEETAESHVWLEKIVAFGRVASGGWGRRKTLFIQDHQCIDFKTFLFKFGKVKDMGLH